MAACSGGRQDGALTPDDELRVGFPEGTGGADFGANPFIGFFTYESLTNNGEDGRAVPRLAESWTWENGGLRLRVVLHPGVLLHDGRPFRGATAADIVRKAVTSGRNKARYAALADVAEVSAPNDRELIFDLTKPSAMLPEDLAVPLDVGKDVVGTGPYRVTKQTDAETVLERFDRYYLGKPSIARVTVHPFQTLRTAWTSLLRGQVDMVYDVPADALEFVRNDNVQVIRLERWYQYVIAFNARRGPLQSSAVRRALNLAVDRKSLIDRVLRGNGTLSTGPVWPTYWAYDNSIVAPGYDPAEAASLLDAAGFPLRASSGNSDHPPARLRFECLLPENFSVWERMALEVQKNLYSIGVDMQFKVVSFDEFNKRMGEGAFEAVFIDMISGPTPGRPYMFWRSAKAERGSYNVFGYEDPMAEQAFDVLRTNTSEIATRSATRRLQRVFAEDPPALFLAWNQRARAIRSDFVIPPGNGRDPLLWLWRWTRSSASSPQPAE